jgi:hypothetical protein
MAKLELRFDQNGIFHQQISDVGPHQDAIIKNRDRRLLNKMRALRSSCTGALTFSTNPTPSVFEQQKHTQ